MSSDLPGEEGGLPLAAREQIDRVCLAFEEAWQAGRQPQIEQHLGDTPEPDRSVLLAELMRVDWHYRHRAGESPAREDYLARFACHAEVVARVCQSLTASGDRADGGTSIVPVPGDTPSQQSRQATPAASDQLVAPTPRALQPSPPKAAEHGRFLPGTLLARRYRIVSLLGRGGMGEVYRADDLKLGVPVALKFLPEGLSGDADLLASLYNEVRLARQIAHPNVCRVYDVSEDEGQHFLSMEYVDGEDLASLLRRIGRLPPDKAVAIARQLLAGLAAAHQQGILHRDLKPANVMLDGRGHVRITDFGLAGVTRAPGDAEHQVGTPLYMSPEQLRGGPTSVRSDLYSAGLVLYEMLTGRPPWQAKTLAQLVQRHQHGDFPRPSCVVDGVEPAVEQVVLQCLEGKPGDRPGSALAALADLPGQDALAAALAAGETPSPEMVAAAEKPGDRHPALRVLGLAVVLVGLVPVVLLSDRTSEVGRVDLKHPRVLAEKAAELIRSQGYDEPPEERAWGFAYSEHSAQTTPVCFWYRQSPQSLVPVLRGGGLLASQRGGISLQDPPPGVPGEACVRLDPQGRLIEFHAFPLAVKGESREVRPADSAAATDSARYLGLFRAAGLVGQQQALSELPTIRPAPATWTTPVSADSRKAWTTVDPESGLPLRVEAAALGDRPVYFRIASAGQEGRLESQPGPGRASGLMDAVALAVFLLLTVAGAVLTRHNLRLGRGDRKGAFRLAGYVFAVSLAASLLLTSRVAELPRWSVVSTCVEFSLFWSLVVWLFYLALEPYVRRIWPEMLISWSRLLAGRLRDPLVGWHLLVGAALGIAGRLLWQANALAPQWCGLGPPSLFSCRRLFFDVPLRPLLAGRYSLGEFFGCQLTAVAASLAILLFLLLLRFVLRREWLAFGALVFASAVLYPIGLGDPRVSWITAGLAAVIVLVLLARFGLVALVSYEFVRFLLRFPITSDLSAWHAPGATIFPLAVIVGLAVFGFYASVSGRRVLRSGAYRHGLLSIA